MQDEEFDELFRAKLNDLEVEPSERVWTGVTKATRHEDRTKKVWLYPGIAASILAVLGIGAVFLAAPQKPPRLAVKMQNGMKNGSPLAAVVDPAGQKPMTNMSSDRSGKKHNVQSSHFIAAAWRKQHRVADFHKTIIGANKPAKNAEEGHFAALQPLPSVKATGSLPLPNVPLQTIAIAAIPEQEVKVQPVAITRETAPGVAAKRPAKHRIRTLGDMFNVVIASVDKRKDKVIEFGNTDDDESTITSVNLGILKIKKDE